MVTNHLDLFTAIRFIQKKYFHNKIKVRGHDKGHLRPKSQIGIGSWIFSDFDYRHIVELKFKFWCTIGHHLVLSLSKCWVWPVSGVVVAVSQNAFDQLLGH